MLTQDQLEQLGVDVSAPAPAPAASANPDGALAYGVDQAQRLTGRGVQAIGGALRQAGADGVGGWIEGAGRNIVEQQDRDIAAGGFKPQYPGGFLDQPGIGAKLGWLGEGIATNAASSVPALAGAAGAAVLAPTAPALAAGALALGGGASFLMNAGESAQELDDKGVSNDAAALGAGVVNTALDMGGAKLAAAPFKLAGSKLAGKAADEAAKKSLGKEVLKATAGEGITEGLQDTTDKAAAALLGASYTPGEVASGFLDSALIGGAMGGGTAALGHAAGRLTPERKAPAPAPAPVPEMPDGVEPMSKEALDAARARMDADTARSEEARAMREGNAAAQANALVPHNEAGPWRRFRENAGPGQTIDQGFRGGLLPGPTPDFIEGDFTDVTGQPQAPGFGGPGFEQQIRPQAAGAAGMIGEWPAGPAPVAPSAPTDLLALPAPSLAPAAGPAPDYYMPPAIGPLTTAVRAAVSQQQAGAPTSIAGLLPAPVAAPVATAPAATTAAPALPQMPYPRPALPAFAGSTAPSIPASTPAPQPQPQEASHVQGQRQAETEALLSGEKGAGAAQPAAPAPIKTERAALAAARRKSKATGQSHEAVAVDGGWRVRATVPPAAPVQADQTAPPASKEGQTLPKARKKLKQAVINERKDTLLTAIAKAGGLSREEAAAHGIDPADFRRPSGVFGRPIFRKSGGMSFDGMAELLHQYGYPVTDERGNYSPNVLLDRIGDELRGQSVRTPEGLDAQAQADQAQREHDRAMREQDAADAYGMTDDPLEFSDAELEASGYADADDSTRRVAEIIAEAKTRLDSDIVEDIAERVATQTDARGATDDEFIAELEAALRGQEANDAAGQARGNPDRPDAGIDAQGEDFALGGYSEADIARREAEAVAAREREEKARKTAEDRARAERDRGQFELTGSDRPADANPRQSDLLDLTGRPERKPAAAQKPEPAAEAPRKSDVAEPAPAADQPAEPAAEPVKAADGYGASNTLFTADAAEQARALLRKKLGQLNAGLDPEIMQAGITLAGYHIEAGARSFAAYTKAMIADLGEAVRPYLRSWYEGVRYYPGMGATGMTPAAEIERADPRPQETQDASGSSPDLERHRRDAGTGDGVGAQDVQDGPAGDGGPAGPRVRGTEEAGRRSADRSGVVDGETVDAGGAGHQWLSDGNEPAGPADGAAGRADAAGRDGTGDTGVPADPAAGSAIAGAAAQAESRPVDLNAKRAAQAAAQGVPVRPGDADNIRESLPFLLDGQRDDVLFAEERFAKPDGYGVLFTNGTGTGKTYTSLGIAKRFERAGRRNILVVVPNQTLADDYVSAAKNLLIDIEALPDTKTAGRGPVITTYAALGQNDALMARDWDLVIADESQNLSQAADGGNTLALDRLRALALHPDGVAVRHGVLYADDIAAEKDLAARVTANSDRANYRTTPHEEVQKRLAENDRLRPELAAAQEKNRKSRDAVAADVEARQGAARPRVVMLSATPFAYRESIQYANGFLLDFPKPSGGGRYNSPKTPLEEFLVRQFGYRMRFGKITKPRAEVDTDLMEVEFNAQLRRNGTLSWRGLSVDADYDRRFLIAQDAIGRRIDEGLEWLREQARTGRYAELYPLINDRFNYLSRTQLLEAIKAKAAIPYIRASLEAGRKVVVFHNYNVGGGFHPFRFGPEGDSAIDGQATPIARQYADFRRERPDLVGLDLSELRSPIETLTAEFPDALLFNGKVPTKQRVANKGLFNSDDGKHRIIVVQADAGGAGLSLHDTTGKYQRVLLNLGLPVRPVTAIQQEGRIYRVGQVTDAVIRYMNTGTNFERIAFAQKVAERSGTVENLGIGQAARDLKRAFIDAFEDARDEQPSAEDGKGGKAADREIDRALSPFDKAKTHYFAQQKQTGRRDQREGMDYFPTPEPIGLKMVEWLQLQPGMAVLEPSAGHGAIARYLPSDVRATAIEPAAGLASRLALVMSGRIIDGDFESLHVSNKYDGIVMNPPFGAGGKTAIEHLAKAATHLSPNGRIVALLPSGPAADKRFQQWYESDAANGFHVTADIAMPAVLFERAGTKASTRVVVIDRTGQPSGSAVRDLSGADTIGELFDRIQDMDVPRRASGEPAATTKAAPETTAAPSGPSETAAPAGNEKLAKARLKVTQTTDARGRPVWKVSGNTFAHKEVIKRAGGKFDGTDKTWRFTDGDPSDEIARYMKFSRETVPAPPAARGIPVEQVRRIVESLSKRYAPEVNVRAFGSTAEVRGIPPGYLVKGVTDFTSGRVFIFADAHTSAADVRRTWLHEAIGHVGVSRLLGGQFGRIRAALEAGAKRDAGLQALFDRVEREEPGLEPDIRAEEVLARAAEDYGMAGPLHWRRVLGMIRSALRRIGLVGEAFSLSDVVYVLSRARETVSGQFAAGKEGVRARFSREAAPDSPASKPRPRNRYGTSDALVAAVSDNDLAAAFRELERLLADAPMELSILRRLKELDPGDLAMELVRPSTSVKVDGLGTGRKIGEYRDLTHSIEMAADFEAADLLHELVHAYTFASMRRVSAYGEVDNILEVYIKAKDAAEKMGKKFYGLQNKYEFVAEAFSNYRFRNFLKSVQTEKRSLWSAFVNGIRELLGIGEAQSNALADLIDAVETDIFTPNKNGELSNKDAIFLKGRNAAMEEERINKEKEKNYEVINLYGVMRSTKNSEGQLISGTKEGIEAFWRWFGDSLAVDEKGRPLILHANTKGLKLPSGSEAAGIELTQDGNGQEVYFRVFYPEKFPDLGNWSVDSLIDYMSKNGMIENIDEISVGIASAKNKASYFRKNIGSLYAIEYEKSSDNGRKAYVSFLQRNIRPISQDWLNMNVVFDDEGADMRYRREATGNDTLDSFREKAGLGSSDVSMRERVQGAKEAAKASVLSRGWWRSLGDNAVQSVVDRFHGIKAAQREVMPQGVPVEQDGYVSARLTTSIGGVVDAVLLDGAPVWKDGILQKIDGSKGLVEALAPVGEHVDDWLGWMVARRAQRLMGEGRENNFTAEEIAAGLALASGREAEFKQAADDYAKLKTAILDVAEKAGLIDASTRPMWDNLDYIPFYRLDEGEVQAATRGKSGLANQVSGIRKLRGGEQALNDPLDNIVRNFASLLDRSMKNAAVDQALRNLDGSRFITALPSSEFTQALAPLDQFRKQLRDAGVDMSKIPNDVLRGMQKVWTLQPPSAPDVISVMRDGHKAYYRVNDPLLLRALTSVSASPVRSMLLMSVARGAKNVLTRAVTVTPAFQLRNFIRDSAHSWIVGGKEFKTFDSIKGLSDALRDTGLAQTMKFAGASFEAGAFGDYDASVVAKHVRRRLGAEQAGPFMATVHKIGDVWDAYRRFSGAVENANREAVGKAALRETGNLKAAVFAAKDAMDFSMRGDLAALRLFTDTIPFLNARIQGLYKLGRSANLGSFAARAAIMTVASLALLAWNRDDDRWKRLEDWDRWNFWHFWLGDQHFRVPKPFEVGLLFSTCPEAAAQSLMGDDRQFWSAVRHGVKDTLRVDWPQIIEPVREVAVNKDSFTDRPIEGLGDQSKASSLRYNSRTSDTMRAIGQAEVGGKRLSDATGLSPKQLEHLWSGYLGEVGAWALDASDALVRAWTGAPARPTPNVRDVPLVGGLFGAVVGRGDEAPTKYASRVYEAIRDSQTAYNSLRTMQKQGEPAKKIAEYRAEHADELRLYGTLQTVADQDSRLRQNAERIRMSQSMTPDAKRAAVDRIERMRQSLMQRAYPRVAAIGY